MDNKELVFYLKLSGKKNYRVTDFHKEEQMHLDEIKKMTKQFNINDIKNILIFLTDKYELIKDDYKVKYALYWMINEIFDKNDMFYSILLGILESEKLCSFYTLAISSVAIAKMGKKDLKNFIIENCLHNKINIILLTYYQTIDKDILEYEDVQEVLDFIAKCDESLISLIDARSLSLHYSSVDDEFSIKMYNIVSKIISNDYVYRSLYDSFFYLPTNQLIELFSNDLETIFKLYMKVLQQHETIDYRNELFKILLNDNPDRIIQFVEDIKMNYYNSKVQDIWSIEKFQESVSKLLDHYYNESNRSLMWRNDLAVLFKKPEHESKRIDYFNNLVLQKTTDIDYIIFLAEIFKEIPLSQRVNYIQIFINQQSENMDVFVVLISDPTMQSYSGNRSAYLADKKREYESILEIIPNERLKYRVFLQEKIRLLDKYIEQVEIYELLNPDFNSLRK